MNQSDLNIAKSGSVLVQIRTLPQIQRRMNPATASFILDLRTTPKNSRGGIRKSKFEDRFRCAACLRSIGMGFKTIVRTTGIPQTTVRRIVAPVKAERREGGFRWVKKRHKVTVPQERRDATRCKRAQFAAWNAEWKTIPRSMRLGEHWAAHPEYVNWRVRRAENERRRNRTSYYYSKLIRTRIRKVLNGEKKMAPTEALLGCSWRQLRAHLEAQFVAGMTWANSGTYWEIDHIIPCAWFDLSKRINQHLCFHHSNLRAA